MKNLHSFHTGEDIARGRGDVSLEAAKQACDEMEKELNELQEQIVSARGSGNVDEEEELLGRAVILREKLQMKRDEWRELSRQFPYDTKAA